MSRPGPAVAALRLAQRVARGEAPLSAIGWAFLNRLNVFLRTGDRRYEFERLYADEADPWAYRTSAYEQAKYRRTLDAILMGARARRRALEIGCSVGVFTGMLAKAFGQVTAVDIADQALVRALDANRQRTNVEFVRGHLQTLALEARYDVITCAEVLCYVVERDVPRVLAALERHLEPDGVVVLVAGPDSDGRGFFDFNGWRRVLAERFEVVSEQAFDDPPRPYTVTVFGRRA